MDEKTVELFRLLAGGSSSWLTNEFRNLASGVPVVMLAIPNLSNLVCFVGKDNHDLSAQLIVQQVS
jgi:hypothetical protein